MKVVTIAAGSEVFEPTSLQEKDSNVSRAYDVRSGALLLVRPDGYIGLAADASGQGQLDIYLAQVSAAGRAN